MHHMPGSRNAIGERRNEAIWNQSLWECAIKTRRDELSYLVNDGLNTHLAKNPVEEQGLNTSKMPILVEQSQMKG